MEKKLVLNIKRSGKEQSKNFAQPPNN